MVKKIISFVSLFTLILFISISCWQAIQAKNRNNLMRLKLGMNEKEVMQIMGKPSLNEAYQTEKGTELVILFYYTNRKWGDGNITRDECSPIVFENGKLVGWGNEFYKMKVEVEIKKQ